MLVGEVIVVHGTPVEMSDEACHVMDDDLDQ